MLPGPIDLLGFRWATWDLLLLLGVALGYFVARITIPATPVMALRYGFVVYICALAAQLFAYAFDANTSMLPPADVSTARYYLSPLAGPKTLYGALLALPIAVGLAFARTIAPSRIRYLDAYTPPMMTVLGFVRIGCLLQGCCYGVRSDVFGLSFPVGSSVHGDQFLQGVIRVDQASLPVLPVQVAASVACFTLAAWSFRAVRHSRQRVYLHTLLAYSAFRFVIEFLRADPARNSWAALSTSQWIALAIVATAAGFYLRDALATRSETAPE